MSKYTKIEDVPIYEGKSYYDRNETLSLVDGPTEPRDCLKRLQMELAYKPYYDWEDLSAFLDENGLDPNVTYDKNLHGIKLLKTVVAVLQALGNNIDLFMSHNTEFGDRGEAYTSLRKRIEDIKLRIRETEKESKEEDNNDFSLMFYTHKK